MAGVFLRTYLVHSTYVLFCTRATISVFIVKPSVIVAKRESKTPTNSQQKTEAASHFHSIMPPLMDLAVQ